MTAEQAEKISVQKKPIIDAEKFNEEYSIIMKNIEDAANNGKYCSRIIIEPNQEIFDKLIEDGFAIYRDKDFFLPVPIYTVSWEKKEKKKFDWEWAILIGVFVLFAILVYWSEIL